VSNPNAAKGRRWELAVRKFLEEVFGRRVLRPHQEGFKDVGDLHLDPFALQLKDEARHSFSSYVDDSEEQARNAQLPYGAAVVKRRNTGVGFAYVVMSLRTFRRVVARLRRAEALLQRYAPEVFHTEHLPEIEKDA